MNITEYIRSNEDLSRLDFETVYYTIYKLIKDGFILEKID